MQNEKSLLHFHDVASSTKSNTSVQLCLNLKNKSLYMTPLHIYLSISSNSITGFFLQILRDLRDYELWFLFPSPKRSNKTWIQDFQMSHKIIENALKSVVKKRT